MIDSDGNCRNQILRSFPAVIGRSSAADLQLSDQWVSRMHCVLTLDDQVLYVRDLESHNGTSVNYETVHGPQVLHIGDVVQVGFTQVIVTRFES